MHLGNMHLHYALDCVFSLTDETIYLVSLNILCNYDLEMYFTKE